MQATDRMASVLSSTRPACRRLIRDVDEIMKWAFPCLIVFFSGCFAKPVKGVDDSQNITSEAELKSVVLWLNYPPTEMVALQRLIKFAGFFLYPSSVSVVTGDEAADELRRAAEVAVNSHRSLESVGRALSSDDRDVRYWGVMSFQSSRWGRAGETREPWKLLLPRLQDLASHDEDADIRSAAILTLQDYEEAEVFLTKLQQSPDETHPFVLMRLLKFNADIPELRARWYAHAVKFLSGKDEALRMLWLQVIGGNVYNPLTAPMWRIEADPALVESLRQIARTGSKKEKELAAMAVKALSQ